MKAEREGCFKKFLLNINGLLFWKLETGNNSMKLLTVNKKGSNFVNIREK